MTAVPPVAATDLRCLACGADRSEPWARARDREYHTTDETFGFHRCAACGAIFIDPVPRDRLATIYPPNYYSFAPESRTWVHRVKDALDRRRFARMLAGIPGSELSVLDVGGGAGAQLDVARAADPRVRTTHVVDLDPEAAARARARGHGATVCSIEEFDTEERFHLIVLLNLIEHVADPGAVLERLRGLLHPEGVILVQTPNTDSLDARWFRHAEWGGYHCPRHWVLFDRASFERLVERSGLAVRHFQYTQGAPFWALSVIFWLERRGWARVDRERPAVYHPLYGPLTAGFAAFDLLRARLGGRPSQMLFVLGREPHGTDPGALRGPDGARRP